MSMVGSGTPYFTCLGFLEPSPSWRVKEVDAIVGINGVQLVNATFAAAAASTLCEAQGLVDEVSLWRKGRFLVFVVPCWVEADSARIGESVATTSLSEEMNGGL